LKFRTGQPRGGSSDNNDNTNKAKAIMAGTDTKKTKTKKRPGVEAGMKLVMLDDVDTWVKIEEQCKSVIESIPKLRQYEDVLRQYASADPQKESFSKVRQAELRVAEACFFRCRTNLAAARVAHDTVAPTSLLCSLKIFPRCISYISQEELDHIVLWKHSVGKNRIYNVKYLNSNTDQEVRTQSRRAIAVAKGIDLAECFEETTPPSSKRSNKKGGGGGSDGDDDNDNGSSSDGGDNSDGGLNDTGRAAVQEAIGELGKLKGVGPATASAVLTLIRPDVFCYLYDEVIDCFEPQRDYKMANYLRVNNRCLQLARTLGDGWTTSRVAKTIWTAARYLAVNGVDLTDGVVVKGGVHGAGNGDDGDGNDDDDDGDIDEEEDEVEDDDDDNGNNAGRRGQQEQRSSSDAKRQRRAG